MARYDVAEKDIVGKKLLSVKTSGCSDEVTDDITFEFEGATSPYRMQHYQDCCEHVRVEKVEGDLQDLVGKVIKEYKEEIDPNGVDLEGVEEHDEYRTVTVYTFVAEDDTKVVLTWVGESNGYYSESVEFERTEEEVAS